VVVGAENIEGNDSSELGWYAFDPKAVSMGDSILAIWKVDSDGQKPNVYMRLLDSNAIPIGEVNLLFERHMRSQSGVLMRQGDNAVLTYCGRYKVGAYFEDEDRITSTFLDSYGHPISEQVRSPTNRVCTYASGEAIWTGSRMIFAWTDVNSSVNSSFGNPDLLLDIADVNGNSISWKSVRSGAASNPHLAIGHGRMLVVVATRTGMLAIHRFDLEGNESGEPVILKRLNYEVNGKIVNGAFTVPYIVPTDDGWMVIAASTTSGVYIVHLAPDGSLISDPVVVEKNLYFANGLSDVISYRGGAVILGQLYKGYVVLFISDNGVVDQQWYPKQDKQPIYEGSFFEHQGHLFLIYTSEPTSRNPMTNQVLIRELQCVP